MNTIDSLDKFTKYFNLNIEQDVLASVINHVGNEEICEILNVFDNSNSFIKSELLKNKIMPIIKLANFFQKTRDNWNKAMDDSNDFNMYVDKEGNVIFK